MSQTGDSITAISSQEPEVMIPLSLQGDLSLLLQGTNFE
jgi:hypothetical protein